MRVILLDDEQTALDELEYLLKKHKSIQIVATYNHPLKALAEFKSIQFDAAFLDIDMPVMNGLNVAKEILEHKSNTGIVFITAHNDYAVKAFDINAIDYVLKPIEKERLEKTVERLLKADLKPNSLKNVILDKLNRIDQYIKQDAERIAAYDEDVISLLKMSDIFFFESQIGKTFVTSASGKYKMKETLDTLEGKLEAFGFFRCHRSYLVNLRYISKLSPMFNNNYVVKQDGHPSEIPVSRNNIKELKKLLGID